MITIATGLIAYSLALIFLGWLAYSIASLPLTIVILVGLTLMLADFVLSIRHGEFKG